ncbi:stage V sporulation protein SpoVS [Actinokineospora baliensis]|uniref:S1 family peptidase n=1 Tax=Actinokineospora baliensis TaxID=547056 RepID=UPI001957DC0C|nr:serine protease [Actinokineospora baliensis]MBM7774358.1 stage V sporulation protein SpoVS [Actinokineospora baliensis]
MVSRPDARRSWRVRVRQDRTGEVLGAGVLVDARHVLTCAHVVRDEVVVDMVGLPGGRVVPAHPVEGHYVPAVDDRGDVALLRLDTPQPAAAVARLRRVALTPSRPVSALGYPGGLDGGVWTRMVLVGPTGSEWVQLNLRSSTEQRVRAGFSGAGVVDDETGDVLGVVVAANRGESASLAWMIPVDAVAVHLPLVGGWVVGETGIDPSFTAIGRPTGLTGEASRWLDWIRRRTDGAVVVIVVGADREAVRKAVAASSGPSDNGSGPGVDIALDVNGRTVEEVARRVADRAGLVVGPDENASARLRAGTPPMTVVLDGVDRAVHPGELVDGVLRPIVEGGGRLVLGFERADSPSLVAARGLVAGVVEDRVARLAARVDALPDDVEWRVRLSALRRAARVDPERVAGALARFERGLRRVEVQVGHKHAAAAQVADDRGLLGATRAMANERGYAEHPGLAARYRAAEAALNRDPVDPAAVHAAVRAYQAEVRRVLAEGGPRGDVP